MCGRYYYADKTKKLVEEEQRIFSDHFIFHPGDVTPGMNAMAMIRSINGHGMDFDELYWGLATKGKKLIINARAESVFDKSLFSEAVQKRRCILPAQGFYEWNREKTKFVFERPDNRPIYLAGVYDLCENRNSFVILTTSANDSMRPVHDRMPVMIDADNVKEYLLDTKSAADLIRETMPALRKSTDYEQLSLFQKMEVE